MHNIFIRWPFTQIVRFFKEKLWILALQPKMCTRCDLCEAAFVHSYCNFCHVNVCKPCIGEHIWDGYDKHKIVPFKERRSTLIYPKCDIHPQKIRKFQCNDCNNIIVCSSCAVSKQHKGHDFEDQKYTRQRKKILKKTQKSYKITFILRMKKLHSIWKIS